MKVTKFGNIVREVKVNVDRDNNPYEFYIAGDHMDSEDLTIHRKGKFSTDDVGPAFTRIFKPGQILYGSRRTYLKKIAVADFEGICANTTFVLETKDDNVFLQSLLPFIMLSDKFTEWSVSHSKGSTNPYVLFSDLASYEFELPSLEEQRVLAEKLWAAYRLKESYKRLLAATDEMVKSQFIEMFGDVEKKPFVDVCISKGEYGSNSPADDYDGNIRYVRITDITEEGNLNGVVVSPRKVEEKYMLLQDDLLFARTGNTVGKTYLHKNGKMIFAGYLIRYRLNKKLMLPQFAFAYTHTNQYYDWVEKIKKVGAQPNISAAQYDSMPIPVPSMAKQIEFVAITKQADKSKFVGFKSQFIEMFGNPLSSKQKNELKKLGECCCINPRRPNITLHDTDKVSFVPMSAVSEDGHLLDILDEEYGKVKKGFTYFENNDVLFAKITPCMENGKGAIAQGLTNGIGMGSTEFHVLRPINEISSPYWLLALTQMPVFRERAAKNMSGTGGQKRVAAAYLEHFMVGVPSIEEQRHFEAIYKQADKSKFELRKSIDAIDQVIKSLING